MKRATYSKLSKKIFITDANYKHTLAIVRTLGKKGLYVIAGATSGFSPAFYSKYCSETIIYPNPKNESKFITFMLNYVKKNKVDVLIPVSYTVTTLFSKHKSKFIKYTKLPIADWSSMKIACNKDKTMQVAEKCGIKIPRTYKTYKEIKQFPVVVKNIVESGGIRYINSLDELQKMKKAPHILQEYIPGEGYGFYALFNKGKVKAIFMHKRVREYPITGGASSAAESIYDPKLNKIGLKLLKYLKWHGIAMVEFKKDSRDNEFKLMEINPKFWGSLDLSIACGVNFPFLLVKMATEGDIKPVYKYKRGLIFRWIFPDECLHLLANPRSIIIFIKEYFNKNIKSNFWFSDIKPNIIQILQTIIMVISRIKNKNLKYPHGIPEFSK